MAELEKRETALTPREWLSRWFEDWPRGFFEDWPMLPRWWPERFRAFEGVEPLRVEEFEEDGTLVVRAEMPGIDPDKDVDIDVSDQHLRIRAERRQETKVEEKGRYRSEFRYGSFARTLPLPVGATEKDVKASYKDGILEVRVPIERGKPEARKIPIQRG